MTTALLIIGGIVWWKRSAIMQPVLAQFLTRTSLSASKVSGLQFDFDRAELSTLDFDMATAVGPLSVRLENVRAQYDLGTGRITIVNIGHANLKLTYQHIDSQSDDEDDTPQKALSIPLEQLTAEQLELDIETPWGLSRFTGRTVFERGKTNAFNAQFQDGQQLVLIELTPDLSSVSVIAEHPRQGRIFELTAEQLNQPHRQASLHADVALLLNWLNSSTLIPKGLRATMATSGTSEIVSALSALQLAVVTETTDGFANVTGRALLSRTGTVLADAKLSRTNTQMAATGQLDMTATDVFTLLKPWLPATASAWAISSGTVRGTFDLHWQPKQNLSGSARLAASGLELSAGAVKIEDGTAEVTVDALANRSITATAAAAKLEFGQDLTAHDLSIKAHYLGDELTLEQTALSMFGGRLDLLPGVVDFKQQPLLLTLRLQNVDLSQLLSSLHYPNLSGTGTMSGELPLRLADGAIELQDGTLDSTTPGELRYRGPAADNENIAFRALRNLAYHSLRAKVNYRPNGDYHLGLRLEGNNAEVLSGHPLAFNLNISGQLPELLRRGIMAGDFERIILEQANTRPAKTTKPTEPLRPPVGNQPPVPPPADRRSP